MLLSSQGSYDDIPENNEGKGYFKVGNIIFQYGYSKSNYHTNNQSKVLFPIPFPHKCVTVNANYIIPNIGFNGDGYIVIASWDKNGFEHDVPDLEKEFTWLAIGY